MRSFWRPDIYNKGAVVIQLGRGNTKRVPVTYLNFARSCVRKERVRILVNTRYTRKLRNNCLLH